MSDEILRNFIFTIEKQEARIAELEAALQKIVDRTQRAHPMSYVGDYCSIAQAALAGGKKDE